MMNAGIGSAPLLRERGSGTKIIAQRRCGMKRFRVGGKGTGADIVTIAGNSARNFAGKVQVLAGEFRFMTLRKA